MTYTLIMLAVLMQAPTPTRDVGYPQWHLVQTQTATGQWTSQVSAWIWGTLQSDGMIRPVTTTPTVAKPKTTPPNGEPYENWGVDLSGLSRTGEKYRASGPASQAFNESVQAGRLVDDSRKLRLTVIGTQAEQDDVRAKLANGPAHELLADFNSKYHSPSDWELHSTETGKQPLGFKGDGHPSMLIQLPDGESVWQAEAFPGDEKMVSGIVYAKSKLRHPDPNYDPSKVPGPNTGPSPANDPRWVEWLASLATIAGVLLMLKNKRNAHAA